MKRKDFLKGIGIAGIGTLLPVKKTKAAIDSISSAQLNGTCVLIPQETAGPYPFDLSSDPTMFRQDITEGNGGIEMMLTLKIVNVNDSCNPIPNARVDLWHCDKDGYYSEFNVTSYLGPRNNTGLTFFRGIQISDMNGEIHFKTIYPGWYPGRTVHIHFQVFLSSVLSATSQLAFPDDINTIMNNMSPYSAHGQNPTTNSGDGVFSDASNTQYEIATMTQNSAGGYDASLVVGMSVPVTGVINLEPETGGQFKMHPNFPNPAHDSTTISFRLTNPSQVIIDVFDVTGKKLFELVNEKMNSGEQKIYWDLLNGRTRLPKGNYIYQLNVENNNGRFFQCKVLAVN